LEYNPRIDQEVPKYINEETDEFEEKSNENLAIYLAQAVTEETAEPKLHLVLPDVQPQELFQQESSEKLEKSNGNRPN